MITLQFVRTAGVGSALIEWFSAGTFSHVDAVLPDGTLLGARADTAKPGVQIRQPDYENFTVKVRFSLSTLGAAEDKLFYDFLMAQIGKPYDKVAILGFALGRNWREDNAWYCSELQAAALEAAGILPQLYVAAAKITPEALALVLSAVGAKPT